LFPAVDTAAMTFTGSAIDAALALDGSAVQTAA
jgi:hypothetical protein